MKPLLEQSVAKARSRTFSNFLEGHDVNILATDVVKLLFKTTYASI